MKLWKCSWTSLAALVLLSIAPLLKLAAAAELAIVPIYDPASKSYFEMVDGVKSKLISSGEGVWEGPRWGEAYRFAQERVYKGVRGRLAIVKSFETHAFLLRTFHPDSEAWIGLRYWCKARQLQWSDGTTADGHSYKAWAKNWRQDVYACASSVPNEYMPVAYSAAPSFQWIGKGINKRYYYFFVEYPTGHP